MAFWYATERSPSSRRAWIEILLFQILKLVQTVALLAEGVDRNHDPAADVGLLQVALLAEGVDRNRFLPRLMQKPWRVALLAEGVDRN